MADETAAVEGEVQDDAQALASAVAGYSGKARVEETPAAASAEQPEQPAEEAPQVIEASPEVQPEKTEAEKIAESLADLKAQVSAIKSGSDPDAVRKLHGEIGNINRTLKQLQAPASAGEAPADDELAAALKEAEKIASEFEEIGGPLVRALKAVAAKQTSKSPDVDIASVVSEKVKEQRELDAIEALAEEHPDWQTVRSTPEYKAWLSSKTPEFQERFNSTWNPAVVAKGLTEFKDSLKVKETKQKRLAAAVTPQGVPRPATPSTIPDEEAALIGYNKGPKRLGMR